ncbi:MAG: hypothetical protein R3D00_21570 [Bacteroidia bacterium]
MNDMDMEPKAKLFQYKVAANIVVISFIVEWLSGYLLGAYSDISSVSQVHVMSLVRALFWAYIWLTFRKLLDEHFHYRDADTFLWVMIFLGLLFPLMGMSGLYTILPEIIPTVLSVGFSAVFILFALSILKIKEDMFGLKVRFAYTMITQAVFSTLFYQVLHIYTFYTLFWGGRVISFLLSLLLAIFLFRIFRKAGQDLPVSEFLHEENLIEKIGDEIEEI